MLTIAVATFAGLPELIVASYVGALGLTARSHAEVVVDRIAATYWWILLHHNHLALLGTVLALIVTAWGIYRILISWDAVRRELFKLSFQHEETGISNRKSGVSKHFQVAKKRNSKLNNFNVNRWINDAITDFDNGKLADAKKMLTVLNGKLQERIDCAVDQERVAKKQQAAIHLFLGSIEAAEFRSDKAIEEFRKTLDLTNEQDTDALTYIAEQKLAESGAEKENGRASVPAQVAYAEAAKLEAIGASKNAQVEALALLLKGRAGVKLPNGRMAAKGNARFGISKLGSIRDDSLNGQLRELLGDVCVLLGHWQEAPDAYREAIPLL